MEMPARSSRLDSGSLPTGRTGHACAQCRHRKQKCGGFTVNIRCRPCTTRKVKCSFQEEVKELHHNPYFRMGSPKSPSIRSERTSVGDMRLSPDSAALIPALTALHERDGQRTQSAAGLIEPSSIDEDLPNQVQLLTSRITDLEKRLDIAQRDHNRLPLEPAPLQHGHSSPVLISPESFPNSGPYSFASSPGAVMTDGPLKTLNRFQKADLVELEMHDPIARSILTEAEACVMFKQFFSHCHPNAPFLDADVDSDPDHVRSSSILLLLSILCVGARFWSAPSKISCWLHPRYPELVRLLDAEIMRTILRPKQEDHKLETVQALILCAHWMPLDISADREHYRSRFSEAGAWHCLGLAIRWATSLELEKRCCTSFQTPETLTRADVRRLRTLLYLTESDHYLALSARRPSCLNPEPLNDIVANFGRSQYVQTTDRRLISLFQVAYCAHFTDCRPTTIESVQEFDRYVQLVERNFISYQSDKSTDAMSQHFPFTSLRWYQLSYTCAFLDNTDQGQWTREALMWAVEWASQILIHLSRPLSKTADSATSDTQLDPDPVVVEVMSFAIDHYFVVIAYAVFFLVNSWLRNLIDLNLRPVAQQLEGAVGSKPRSSLLFRLVDVAARTLATASPPEGHLARRYVPLLRGMADIVVSDNTQSHSINIDTNTATQDTRNLPEQPQSNLGEDLWDLWQDAGLEPINWPSLANDMQQG